MPPVAHDKFQKLLDLTFVAGIGLVVALLILAALIHWLRSWYRDGDGPADGSDQILTRMEELRREGGLSDEEFRSIKGQLSGRKDA